MQTSFDAVTTGLSLEQPLAGYRCTSDTVDLADFAAAAVRAANPRAPQRELLVLDLGAGAGALSLLFYQHWSTAKLVLLERDTSVSEIATRNLERVGARGRVLSQSVDAPLPTELQTAVDLVLCNPPYFLPGSSRAAPEPVRREARQGSLAPFLTAARAALRPRGRLCLCYPPSELASLLAEAALLSLHAKRLQWVYPRLDAPARLALLELRPAKPGGLQVLPPLIRHGPTTDPT